MGDLRAALGKRLQVLRERAGVTQEQLAGAAGIDHKYLADVEHARKGVSLDVLERIMRALNVKPSDLFSFSLHKADRDQEAISALVQSLKATEKRLVLNLLRGILRWRDGEKT